MLIASQYISRFRTGKIPLAEIVLKDPKLGESILILCFDN